MPTGRAAASEAARAALLGCASPVLALLFATPDYSAEEVAEAANLVLESTPWVGVMTPAVLAGHEVMSRGVGVGVIDCDRTRVRVGVAAPSGAVAREAGRRAARGALQGMPLPPADRSRAMLLFAGTERYDLAEVVHGALGVAGAGVAWCGGGTGTATVGAPSVQFAEGRVLRDHVVAVTLDCPARPGVGIEHGWQPIGPPAMVTRVDGTLLRHLEHRPAFDIYRAAALEVGERLDAKELGRFAMTHPLGIPQADGAYLIRDPLAVEEGGALRFMAGVPDGALVRVMEGTPEMLVEAARAAASMAREDTGVAPGGALGGALVFDCISRYLMLGEALRSELSACQGALGADVPLLGCLTFGEVGSFGSRMPQFHNKTMVVLALPS